MDIGTILIIVVVLFIVIGAVRSSAKKKKRAEDARRQSGQPGQAQQMAPRPPAMSDIQRAFSMMSDADSSRTPTARPTPPARQLAAYSTEGRTGLTEGRASSIEGRTGLTEGRASSIEGRAGLTEGRASSIEGRAGLTEGRASSIEGKAGLTEGREFHKPGAHAISSAYAKADLKSTHKADLKSSYQADLKGSFQDDEEDDFGNLKTGKKYQRTGGLKLFENQSDFMKAVIYSEILTRKS